VDIAVATTHGAKGGAEIGADGIEDRLAESEAPGTVANQGRKNVAFAQGKANGDAESLLAAAKKDAAMDFAHAVKAGEFIVENAGQEHDAVRLDVLIAQRKGLGDRTVV
jgi:hypothetical protein